MYPKQTMIAAILALAVSACGTAEDQGTGGSDAQPGKGTTAPVVSFTPGGDAKPAGKPMGPVTVAYRIVGEPVVGQPVAVELDVRSTLGPKPVTIRYRINDSSAMQLAESQPDAVTMAPNADGVDASAGVQQVRVIPLREGRIYLNVSASVDMDDGTMSTVTAIPIQVGDAPRVLEEQGELTTDEEGNALRVLPAKED